MCCNYTIINETKNGLLVFLKGCQKYQLTFKNLCFSLSELELEAFKSFLNRLDTEYWETEYRNSVYSKKIPIPTLQNNFIIMINRYELFEMQCLTSFNTSEITISHKLLHNKFYWN